MEPSPLLVFARTNFHTTHCSSEVIQISALISVLSTSKEWRTKGKEISSMLWSLDKETNIYTSWEECQAATKGKRNVKYKGFTEKEQAEAYIKRHKNKRVSVMPE